MPNEWQYFPHAMTMHDLDAMREAFRIAEERIGSADEVTDELLARIVFRYYRGGMTDPEHLGAIAAFLSRSRVFAPMLQGSGVEAGAQA
jgi:hypothetical protein